MSVDITDQTNLIYINCRINGEPDVKQKRCIVDLQWSSAPISRLDKYVCGVCKLSVPLQQVSWNKNMPAAITFHDVTNNGWNGIALATFDINRPYSTLFEFQQDLRYWLEEVLPTEDILLNGVELKMWVDPNYKFKFSCNKWTTGPNAQFGIKFSRAFRNVFHLMEKYSAHPVVDASTESNLLVATPPVVDANTGFGSGMYTFSYSSFCDNYHQLRRVFVESTLPSVSEWQNTNSKLRILSDWSYSPNQGATLSYTSNYDDWPSQQAQITEIPASQLTFFSSPLDTRWLLMRGTQPLYSLRMTISGEFFDHEFGTSTTKTLTLAPGSYADIKLVFISKKHWNPQAAVNYGH